MFHLLIQPEDAALMVEAFEKAIKGLRRDIDALPPVGYNFLIVKKNQKIHSLNKLIDDIKKRS